MLIVTFEHAKVIQADMESTMIPGENIR